MKAVKAVVAFFAKKYVYAVFAALAISVAFTYTLLDAFVLQKVYMTGSPLEGKALDRAGTDKPGEEPANGARSDTGKDGAKQDTIEEPVDEDRQKPMDEGGQELADNEKELEPVITDNMYKDENISISIEKLKENGVTYYVADIRVADAKYIKTAFAKDSFGKNITEKTSDIARKNNAIFAINGDFYGFRDEGLIIRNSFLYRDIPKKEPYNEALALYDDGRMEIILEGEADAEELLKKGIYQTFSFGPVLVLNGKEVDRSILKKKSAVPSSKNPRTAIGMIEPLHYIVVVVDGRSKLSSGMTLSELARVFVDRGCTLAYNLDGGGSSTMFFNDSVINYPTDGRKAGERKISDIIYIVGKEAIYE